MNQDLTGVAARDTGRNLLDDVETEVLEHRHHLRQRQLLAPVVEAEPRESLPVVDLVLKPDQQVPIALFEARQRLNVPDGDVQRGGSLVVLG